jgi:alcohol dehydrogenase
MWLLKQWGRPIDLAVSSLGAPLPTTAVIDGPNRFLAIWRIIKLVSSALAVTKERGFDVVIEAVGTPESFETAQALVRKDNQ